VVDKVIGICYGGTGKENTIYFKVAILFVVGFTRSL
jgi:hypothetical protein